MRIHPVRSLALLLASLLAAPALVFASGFQLVEQNGSGLGNAYAGQAAAGTDASTVYFNPAGLTALDGQQFVIALSPIGVSTRFNDSRSGRPFLPAQSPFVIPVALGGSGGNAGGWIPVPNAYLSWRATDKIWLGFGVNVPFGLKTDWDPGWEGRFHAVKSEVQTINLNPSMATRVTDWLAIGAGASYQRLDAELTQNLAYGGIAFGAAAALGPAASGGILAQLGPGGLAREGLARMRGDDWSWGWNVGVQMRLDDAGRVAASYRSRVKHEIRGEASFADAPVFATTGPLGRLGGAINERFAPGPITAAIELPDSLSLAAAYMGDRLELMADWTWTGWSSIQDLRVVREGGSELANVPLMFQDTWRLGGGASYWLRETLKLRLGVAYDVTPVQDEHRTPRLPDEDRTWVAAGFQYKLGAKSAFDLGYAHLFVKDATSNLPNQAVPTGAPAGNLVGTYPGSVNLLTVQYRISF
jgi:long-chain fatty acid transport protein